MARKVLWKIGRMLSRQPMESISKLLNIYALPMEKQRETGHLSPAQTLHSQRFVLGDLLLGNV